MIVNSTFSHNVLYYFESYEGTGAILLDSPDNFIISNSLFQVTPYISISIFFFSRITPLIAVMNFLLQKYRVLVYTLNLC